MCRCYGGKRKDNVLYSGCEKSLRKVLEGKKEGVYTTATKASHQQGPSFADCRWASFEFLTLFR